MAASKSSAVQAAKKATPAPEGSAAPATGTPPRSSAAAKKSVTVAAEKPSSTAAKKTSGTATKKATGTATTRTAGTAATTSAAKTSAAKATAAQTSAAKTTAAQTSAAKTTAGTKTAAKKAAAAKTAATASDPTTGTATTAPSRRTAAKKSTAAPDPALAQTTAQAAAQTGDENAEVGELAVREGEAPWTAEEVAEVRALLDSDRDRLMVEISTVEEEIGHLLREGGEGAGHDQADVGSNTFERDHEMSIARNARDNLVLVQEAIKRIDAGAYGVCESCGRPVGKMRLQAFPRATLCLECKQRSERR